MSTVMEVTCPPPLVYSPLLFTQSSANHSPIQSFCPSLTRKHQLLLWTFANKSLHLSGDSPTSPPLSLSPSPGFLSSAMTPNHTLTTTSSKSPNSCKSKDQDAQNRKARFSNFTIDHLLKDSSLDSSSTSETVVVDAESRIPPSPSYHPYREGLECKKRKRKLRTVFTSKQLAGLEKTFAEKKYLSVPDRIKLAMELELSDTQVKTWFQNRRMKEKKMHEEDYDDAEAASFNSRDELSSIIDFTI